MRVARSPQLRFLSAMQSARDMFTVVTAVKRFSLLFSVRSSVGQISSHRTMNAVSRGSYQQRINLFLRRNCCSAIVSYRRQFVRRARVLHTVVRLGAYTVGRLQAVQRAHHWWKQLIGDEHLSQTTHGIIQASPGTMDIYLRASLVWPPHDDTV
jgi:hypothetical protein